MDAPSTIVQRREKFPDSKVHEAYMGPTWGRQDPGGPHFGPMNLPIRAIDEFALQFNPTSTIC